MYQNLQYVARKLIEARKNGTMYKSTFRYLGGGCFGSAYLLPDGRVLKIARTFDSTVLWIREAARVFAATGKPGEHMPVVLHFEQFAEGWWAVMERVTPRCESHGEGYSWLHALERVHPTIARAVDSQMKALGSPYGACDTHWGNWGETAAGRVVVFDPGSDSKSNAKRTRPISIKRQYGPAQGRWAC